MHSFNRIVISESDTFSCHMLQDIEPQGFDVSDILTCTKPAQPDPKLIVVQKRDNCVLSFQEKWFKTFPWLHYSATLQGVICFHCAKVFFESANICKQV